MYPLFARHGIFFFDSKPHCTWFVNSSRFGSCLAGGRCFSCAVRAFGGKGSIFGTLRGFALLVHVFGLHSIPSVSTRAATRRAEGRTCAGPTVGRLRSEICQRTEPPGHPGGLSPIYYSAAIRVMPLAWTIFSSSASSSWVRSVSGGRTGPGFCPRTRRPALMIETA